MKVTIVGTGYVGLVSGACFAEVGHDVLCVDTDETKIARLKRLDMPIYEEGLEEMVTRNHQVGRIQFTASIEEGVAFADVIFIAVGTPPGYKGEADLSYVMQVGRDVAKHMTSYKLLVEKSTVPVNTGEQLRKTVEQYRTKDTEFDVASNPEFLREGTAIPDALNPDRIVVGVESDRAAALLEELYQPIVERSGCELLRMNIASAELTKHASNSFLATKISFINAVSRICELAGADVNQVAHGMGLDSRIGSKFLEAGVGYGGSCFPKDVDAFVYISEQLGYDFELLKEVQRINQTQREHLFKKMQEILFVLDDKTVAVLGLAFKPGTDDIREAPSLYLVPRLAEKGTALRLWDPAARENFEAVHPGMSYIDDLYACIEGSDLLLILTDWPEVVNLDLKKVKSLMKQPVILDGRNIFDPKTCEKRVLRMLLSGGNESIPFIFWKKPEFPQDFCMPGFDTASFFL